MRLFEVDTSAVIPILKVLTGLAGSKDTSGEIPFSTVMHYLKPYDLPLGGVDSDRQQIMTALKRSLGPAGEIIKDIKTDGSIVLKKVENPSQVQAAQTPGPNIDQMASSGAKKLNPEI